MKLLLPVLALVAAGCVVEPSIPQYMQDLPKTGEEELQALGEIRRELGEGTRVDRVEDCFFVATNDSMHSFDLCKQTVARVYAHLYKNYFTKKPAKPIRVYLFKDKTTYEEYCRNEYGEAPSTPFGFYMSRERKTVMNIATGRGTLAHELVHPLLGEDFPDVPSWFNEGFASLHEQSMERDGLMVGLVNWRLPRLQEAIREGKSTTFRELMTTTSGQFYGDSRSVNYAAARYLCLYLQDHGLLVRFYKEFRDGCEKDRTGVDTLEKVVGTKLEEFEKTWREWILKLRLDR